MPRDLNLYGLAYFEVVARLGRITKAADELGVSPSAVSQQIRLLERQFGVRLFNREARHLNLTQEGERLFQVTSVAFRMIRDVRTAIVRRHESRQLIARVCPSLAVRWLGPRIKSFIDTNAQWELRIDASPDYSNFETEAVDLDVRYGRGDWGGLHCECVLHDFVLPMCSPGYLAQLRAASADPYDGLKRARLIDSIKTLYRWDLWLARHEVDAAQIDMPLRFDRSSMAIQLALDGGGVVLESATLTFDELSKGLLVPLTPDFDVIDIPAYWLVCPSRYTSRRIVRIFSDWFRETGRAHDDAARALLQRLGCNIVEGTEPYTNPQ